MNKKFYAILALIIFVAMAGMVFALNSRVLMVHTTYLNTNNTATAINLTITHYSDINETNMTSFNLSTSNNETLNFTGIAANASSLTACTFGNETDGSWLNCTFAAGADRNNTTSIWIQPYVITEFEGQHNITVTISTNDSVWYSNNSTTILADFTDPVLSEWSNNTTAAAHWYFNTSVNVSVNATDNNLNLTRVNISIVNRSNTGQVIKNITDMDRTASGDPSWDFTMQWNASADNAAEGNYTFAVTAYDNASNSVTEVYTGWFYYDNETPTVSSTAPANTTTGVAVSDTISVTFAEYMANNTTLNGVNFVVNKSGTNVSGTLSTTDNVTYTFAPAAELSYGMKYNVTISTSAADYFNKTMASSYMFEFTTKPMPAAEDTTGGGIPGPSAVGELVTPIELPAAGAGVKSVTIAKGNSVSFDSVESGTGTKAKHKIKVISIVGTTVTLRIESDAQTITTSVNEPQYLDLDGDGTHDLFLQIKRVSAGSIDLDVEMLAEEGVALGAAEEEAGEAEEVAGEEAGEGAGEEVITGEEGGEETVPLELSQNMIIGIVIVVILIIGGGYWFFTQKK